MNLQVESGVLDEGDRAGLLQGSLENIGMLLGNFMS